MLSGSGAGVIALWFVLLGLFIAVEVVPAVHPPQARGEGGPPQLCGADLRREDIAELGGLIQGLSADPDTPKGDTRPLTDDEVSWIHDDAHVRQCSPEQ